MQEHHDEIRDLGAGALGISVAADFQAQHLMNDGIDFELLLDPERNFKERALEVRRIPWWTYLLPSTLWNYLKWARRTRQGRITAGPTEPPAVAIVDTDGVVRYVHRGAALGDYPPIDEVMAHLREVAAT